MKNIVALIGFFLFLLGCGETFIIPDEIPSLLSVIYSNIPTVKKGTDSRLGWGFRLGDRADFQMIVELGPQQYTQPLGNELDKKVSSKRAAAPSLRDVLKAQREAEKRAALKVKTGSEDVPKAAVKKVQNATDEGNRWLHSWAESLGKNGANKSDAKPGLGVGEIDAKSVIPEDSPKD